MTANEWVEAETYTRQLLRQHFISSDQIGDFRRRFNNYGLFTSIYRYQGPSPYVGPVLGPFYTEFDCKENLEQAKRECARAVTWLQTVRQVPPVKDRRHESSLLQKKSASVHCFGSNHRSETGGILSLKSQLNFLGFTSLEVKL